MRVLIVHSGNAVLKSEDYTFVKEQGDALAALGVCVSYFAIKGKGIRGYLSNYSRLKNEIKRSKPDIVHAHFGLCGALCILQHKVPVVVTYHNGETLTWYGKIISSITSWFATWNIYVAQHIHDHLYLQPDKYTIQPCGVFLDEMYLYEKEEAQKNMHLKQGIPNILFAGSFANTRKNYPLAKKAIEILPYTVNLIEMKDFDRKQVNQLLCACDALLLPTKSEGSPQVVKEAMACNCPIVATDVADIAYLLNEVENCYVTTFDANEIACKLDQCIKQGMRSNGRQRIKALSLDNFQVAETIRNIYQKILIER